MSQLFLLPNSPETYAQFFIWAHAAGAAGCYKAWFKAWFLPGQQFQTYGELNTLMFFQSFIERSKKCKSNFVRAKSCPAVLCLFFPSHLQ